MSDVRDAIESHVDDGRAGGYFSKAKSAKRYECDVVGCAKNLSLVLENVPEEMTVREVLDELQDIWRTTL